MQFLSRRRFWVLIVLPPALFVFLSYMTQDQALILILSVVLTAISTTATVAFTPEAFRIIHADVPMTRSSYLVYGIWVSWSANVYGACLGLFWRFVGEPDWIPDSDFTSLRLFLLCVAGACHVIKPDGLTEHVPTREAIRVGLIVGAAVGIGLLIVYFPDICTAWHGRAGTVSDVPWWRRA